MKTRALKRLCHGCLVHWVNIASNAYYFAKELDVSEEGRTKRSSTFGLGLRTSLGSSLINGLSGSMVSTLTSILQGLNEHTDVTEHLTDPVKKNPLQIKVFFNRRMLSNKLFFFESNF